MRIAVLWANLTGYTNACFAALAQASGSPLFVAFQEARADAPFESGLHPWMGMVFPYKEKVDAKALIAALDDFAPELLLVTSWNNPAYRRVCRYFRNRAVRVCCMDNPWRGRSKQWLGVVSAPIYVKQMFDAAFVAGERAAVFARKLGFSGEQIWRGLYCCDHDRFQDAAANAVAPREDAFLYVGRLAKEKAVDVLIDAYGLYRVRARNPWPLWVVGTGPLRELANSKPGIVCHGFVQPRELPPIFARAAALVLPSRFEPWGVVIHEATAAGLPVICTERCGAAVHLVQDGYNGYLTAANDAGALARALGRLSSLSAESRQEMSVGSMALSRQFTPRRWAAYVLERAAEAGAAGKETRIANLAKERVSAGTLH